MKRNVAVVLGTLAIMVLGGAAWFFNQGDAEPTTEVTAPPVESPETTANETTVAEPATEETTTVPPPDADAAPTTFELTDATTATFLIDEVLRGTPTTVVGVSDIVVGQIQIDRDELANSRIGEILINARAFETDSSFRNRAIRGPILDTDVFEFISFEPTSIDGLQGSAVIGEEVSFTVTGDLTIRDITRSVTFDVVAIFASDTRIEGTATTTVERGPFELVIPSVASVADVSDSVPLELAFVAEST